MPSPPGTMVNMILNNIIQSFQEPNNRERMQSHFIDPLLKYILNRMFPYIILTCIIFCIILLMSFISVVLLVLHLHSPIVSSAPIAASIVASMASPMASPMAMASPMPITALTDSMINTIP